MKEIVFLNTNVKRWRQFEELLNKPSQTKPDTLAELFIQITDDLAYSRTYYPQSDTTKYLNSLALRAHQLIYVNKKEKGNRIQKFWGYEFPSVIFDTRKFILYSFLIMFIASLIGAISTANDDTFVRLILGDYYVNMTLENIKNGDPLAVYKHAQNIDMFLGISINNIRVSFIAFVMGLFTSFGTGMILFQNGVMLGCFQYFFYQHGLLMESVLTIWIHGTLEIFAIIVAGAAGMVLGNSFIFPGTYSRLTSFIMNTRKGVKMVVGLVPIFITAAFFEGFITRYYQSHWAFRLPIIVGSLIFIIWYFFIYPAKVKQFENEPI